MLAAFLFGENTIANILEIIVKAIRAGTGFKDSSDEAKGLEKQVGEVDKALQKLGIALGAHELIEFGKASVTLARAQIDAVNTLEAASEGLGDYTEAMRLARQETNGMASQTELAGTMATLFGAKLATSNQEAAQLASSGAILSGVFADAGASMDLYVRLLSSGSIELFNNFGLTRQLVAEKQREVEATTNLTGADARQQAIKLALIDTAQKYKSALSDDTVAAKQFEAATADAQAALGMLLLPQVTESMQNLGAAARFATEGMEGMNPAVSGAVQGFIDLANPLTVLNSLIRDYQQITGGAVESSEDVAAAEAEAAAAAEAETAALGPLNSSLIASGHSARGAGAGQEALARGMAAAAAAANQQQQALDAASARYQGMANSMRTQGEAGRDVLETMAGGSTFTADEAEEFKTQQAEKEKATKQLGQTMAKSFQQAADEIGNVISGKLQTTFQEVFKLPEGSTDQADEPARRLATVAAAGFGSEWLTQLNAQFAGQDFWAPMTAAMQSGSGAQLQAAATGILQQFSQGLITNLFDVNIIRAQVRAEMVQKNLREQLIEEVRQGLGTAGVAQAVGVVEVAAGNVGVATAQTETNVSTMATTAQIAGEQIKGAFDGPVAAIDMLILRIAQLIKMLERVVVVAQNAANGIAGLNPPAPGANGSGVPSDAQRAMGGPSPL